MSLIGKSTTRLEDAPLLQGTARFAADIFCPGQLHMRVVRSQVAYGRIRTIDVDQARMLSGVAGVWTAADIVGIPPIDFRQVRVQGLEVYRQPVLARDIVRYVGEPVAVVFAEDSYLAEDAADLILPDIEEWQPTLRATDMPAEHEPGVSAEAAIVEKGYGDIEAAFAWADHVIELALEIGRHSGVPLETRGGLATYDAVNDLLEIHGAAKIPHLNRAALALMLGLEVSRLQIYESHVGGGFGVRGELYPEDVLLCLAARRLMRPVRWIEDRWEHLVAANHSRDQVYQLRAAVSDDGLIRGLECEFWTDQGAYVRTHAATVTDLSAALLPGPYLIPAYHVRGHICLTNKTPAGTYRAPGRYESTFARERLTDMIALRLGKDPLEIRRRNLIPTDRMPFSRSLETLGTEVVLDSGDYVDFLDKTVDQLGYRSLQERLAQRRQDGEHVGVGLALFVEKSGLGPSDTVHLVMEAGGTLEIVTGAASMGQGVETALAQICASELGIELARIRVTHGQTDRIAHGLGAFASRVTVMTGSAVHIAAAGLRTKLLEEAAELLQLPARLLEIREGIVRPVGADDGPCTTVADVVNHYYREGPPGCVLRSEGTFVTEHMTYPYGAHIAVVGVDPETASVSIERFVVAYDVGVAVNPMLIEGQLVGGAVQGIGGALLEEFTYDSSGQPLAASLMDYRLPTIAEVPDIETLVFEDAPSPLNPLGVKGAGEGGINAAGAAIAAAIDDAVGCPGAVTRLPVDPEQIIRALRSPASQGCRNRTPGNQ